MKYILTFFLFVFLNSYSQSKNPIIKVQYAETISYVPSIINNYQSSLYIQDEYSYYKSEYLNTDKSNSKNEEDDVIIVNSFENKFINEVYINNKAKELTENKYENKFLKKSYSIYEELPKMKWEFLKGEKKIKNYTCKKAKTTFRGRTYTVWYTEKIAVKIGPWKFNGLPGLILSIEDSAGIYKWEVKSITYPYKGSDINLKESYSKRFKYTKLSFKDYDDKLITSIKDKIETIKARNNSRSGIKVGFDYSTFQDKEPINEYRTKMNFD